MAKYNFNFFQIPTTGVPENDIMGDQQTRSTDARLSNFGALAYGVRSSVDYTKLTNGFNIVENPTIPYFLPTGDGNFSNAVNNPYVVGSTVKRIRSDELDIMLLGSRKKDDVTLPGYDVMDTHLVADTTYSGVKLNFPTEGYKSFGLRTGGPFEYVVSM